MADTGKQSPLGVNVLGSILSNTGLNINPVAAAHMGSSKTNSDYIFGSVVQNTVLRLLTWAINDGYLRGPGNSNATLTNDTYNNLISIGVNSLGALGNSKPPTYVINDPAGNWTTLAVASGGGLPGPATSGYSVTSNVDQGQQATWIPYDTTNPNKSITQWGYVRLHALQAWYEFNWNGAVGSTAIVQYKDFCASFISASGFISQSNKTILSLKDSDTFLEGVYSNMDDLISADIAGVNLSTTDFGTDLINLGKTINLKNIATFGLPSNLLQTLGKNSAITQDLSLALLASGLSSAEISSISAGTASSITIPQEQQIYGAFLIITGTNLANVLAPLQCSTSGFTSLADLLNVQKLFPISYSSLTVPVYNGAPGLPTNSKTYYLIYSNGGLNNTLDSPAIREYVGVQLPSGNPQIFNNSVSPNNFRELPKGFGSYLKDVIPPSQAIAAGAFSYSMRQIRNIEYCNFQKFAKVVKGIETTNDLTLVNGTSKPTDQTLSDFGTSVCALGSGPYGTYTYSDMVGCMSGLPYPWQLLQARISQLTTSTLSNIYRELFLAVTWEQATASLSLEYDYVTVSVGYYTSITDPLNPQYPGYWTPSTYQRRYRIAGVSRVDDGGGYGRGTAPPPAVSFSYGSFSSDGATAVTAIGTNDADARSNSFGTFGRIKSLTLSKGSYTNYGSIVQAADGQLGPPTMPGTGAPVANSDIRIFIQAPPTQMPSSIGSVLPTGYVNTSTGTAGWSATMNNVLFGTTNSYINQANAEIVVIQNNNVDAATHLKTYWNLMGTQLKIEQRARYTAITPTPDPKDYFMNPYPLTQTSFVDSIPELSKDTRPHMSSQTLEAISNMNLTGGQSVVAMMRQERNQSRLQTIGIELDNNMPDTLSLPNLKSLLTNGTLAGAVEGIQSPTGDLYTIPSWPANETANTIITPIPIGIFVANPVVNYTTTSDGSILTGFVPSTAVKSGDITPILEGATNPIVNVLVPVGPASGPGISGIGGTGISGIGGTGISGTSGTGIGTAGNSSISTGTGTGVANHIVIIGVPSGLNVNNLPPNLDPNYTSSTLFPATPSIAQAIEQVIACNCDCWV